MLEGIQATMVWASRFLNAPLDKVFLVKQDATSRLSPSAKTAVSLMSKILDSGMNESSYKEPFLKSSLFFCTVRYGRSVSSFGYQRPDFRQRPCLQIPSCPYLASLQVFTVVNARRYPCFTPLSLHLVSAKLHGFFALCSSNGS